MEVGRVKHSHKYNMNGRHGMSRPLSSKPKHSRQSDRVPLADSPMQNLRICTGTLLVMLPCKPPPVVSLSLSLSCLFHSYYPGYHVHISKIQHINSTHHTRHSVPSSKQHSPPSKPRIVDHLVNASRSVRTMRLISRTPMRMPRTHRSLA